MKYKLIKWYPSLPNWLKVGDIVKIGTINKHYYYKEHKGNKKIIASSKEVENNSEFWEKVEEKKYEILSFFTSNNNIYKKGRNDNFWCGDFGNLDLEHCLKQETYNIHSVKRFSDGEVFTVGDRIKLPTGTVIKIDHIAFPSRRETKDEIYLHDRKRTKNEPYTKNAEINKAELVKKPLFTTEDGVDIYEGDEYWIVYEDYDIAHIKKTGFDSGKHNSNTYFSTKEKAQEYVDKNKPIYSKQDVLETVSKVLNDPFNKRKNCLHKIKNELNL